MTNENGLEGSNSLMDSARDNFVHNCLDFIRHSYDSSSRNQKGNIVPIIERVARRLELIVQAKSQQGQERKFNFDGQLAKKVRTGADYTLKMVAQEISPDNIPAGISRISRYEHGLLIPREGKYRNSYLKWLADHGYSGLFNPLPTEKD